MEISKQERETLERLAAREYADCPLSDISVALTVLVRDLLEREAGNG